MIAIVELFDNEVGFREKVDLFADKIIYDLKSLDNCYIIETDSIQKYQGLDYIESITNDEIGRLETIKFIPDFTNHALKKASLVGWGGVNVAVVDSGANNINATNAWNFIDDNDDVTDYCNHGSIVSQIIKYFAPGCKINILKITNDSDDIKKHLAIMALDCIAQNSDSINIVNLSFGFSKCNTKSCVLCKLVKCLTDKGVLVVVAAGNDGPERNTIGCPGRQKSALTVGALSKDGLKVAQFSSRGSISSRKPDLVAPAHVKIKLEKKNEPIDVDGTSFATPIITGICASFFYNMNKNSVAVKNIIKRSLTKLNGVPIEAQGQGAIDINRLLEVLKNEANSSGIKQSGN